MLWNRRQSILLLTTDRIVRIDVVGGKLLGVWKQPRSTSDSLTKAIAVAALLAERGLGETWILANDFWSSHVTLAQDVVQSIPRESLEQAIAFELEYDSGLDPFSTRVSFIPAIRAEEANHAHDQSSQATQWWVLQIENSIIEEASKIVAGRRGTLAGLSIPIGIAAEWIDESSPLPLAIDAQDHSSHEQIAAWASDWLAAVRADVGTFPALRLGRCGRPALQGRQLVSIVAAGAIALCSGHYLLTQTQGKQVLAEIAGLQAAETPLREEIKKLELEVAHSASQRNQTAEQLAHAQQRLVLVRQQQALWDSDRQFPTSFIQALQSTAEPSRCILHIAYSRQQSIEIQGLALGNEDVLSLAVRLEKLLPGDQWNVLPPKMSLPVLGGPVHFTISVRCVGAATNAPRSLTHFTAPCGKSPTLVASTTLVESTGGRHAS